MAVPEPVKFSTFTEMGETIDVSIDATGSMTAMVKGTPIHARTLEKVREEARRILLLKRAKIHVPIGEFRSGKFVVGYIKDQHATNGKYLVRWETPDGKGESDTIDTWGTAYDPAKLTQDAIKEIAALTVSQAGIVKRLEELKRPAQIRNLRDIVDAAIKAANTVHLAE